jgi:hypothetical protein
VGAGGGPHAVRTTIRGWLNDLVTTAESTALPAKQLPELLREVLAARASGDDTSNVVRFMPTRRQQ